MTRAGVAVVTQRPIASAAALCGGAALIAAVASPLLGGVSPIVLSAAIGLAFGNVRAWPSSVRPDLGRLGRPVLQAGVALLGLRLVVADLIALGVGRAVGVIVVVAVTFGSSVIVGRLLGLNPKFNLLVATGFSICGVSAISAAESTLAADEEDVVRAIALVTICGTAAVAAVSVARDLTGLSDAAFGAWVGGSIHDVGQVVAAASSSGPTSLAVATLVKLTRVLLLAPVVTGLGMHVRRGESGPPLRRVHLAPPVVLAFLLMVCVRSTGVVPDTVVRGSAKVAELLLSAALFAIATGVSFRSLRVGWRPLALASVATVVASAAAYANAVMAW